MGVLISRTALGLTIPERPQGYVHDEARLLSTDERNTLESKLSLFEQETSNQIVVALFPSLDGESLEDFSIHLAEKWKVGQKGKDNGLILLIFPNDHRLRIEVGYGLESVVPDAYASRIIEEKLKPAFRRGEFYAGIDAAVDSLMAATRGIYEPETKQKPSAGFFKILIYLLFFVFFTLSHWLSRGRRRRGWTIGGGYYGGGGGWGSGGDGGFSGGGGGFGGGGSSGNW